jgi:hypothetical protein
LSKKQVYFITHKAGESRYQVKQWEPGNRYKEKIASYPLIIIDKILLGSNWAEPRRMMRGELGA